MNNKNGGLSLGSVLLVAFIVLKLCGVIAWSWVWVLSPLWISLCLYLVVSAVVVIVISFLDSTIDKLPKRGEAIDARRVREQKLDKK